MLFPLRDENPSSSTPYVTFGLVAINALVLLYVSLQPQEAQQRIVYEYGFVPARISALEADKPIVLRPHPAENLRRLMRREQLIAPQRLDVSRGDVLLSLLTCMFLHGGLAHLVGNMWFLWIFGNNIEDRLGHVLFLLFYLAGGLAATFCHWATGPESVMPVIGASGAVAAVLGAYAVTYPFAQIRTLLFLVIFFTVIDLPALAVLGLWFLGQLLEARRALGMDLNGGVAWWAHVGGFAAGALAMGIFNFIAGPAERHSWDAWSNDADYR
ncbi:MAG: rhomboid family intramembrane serine protease [Pirellulales bacterium]|nr:rhomboid family intramembrane serine protease [Pirellulales bacterium]